MSKGFLAYIFSFLGMLMCFQVSQAQDTISLAEAVNMALKNNYDIQLAKNNVEIAQTNNSYGMAGGLPSINGTASDQQQIQDIRQETAGAGGTTNTRVANGATANTLAFNVTGSLVLFNGMRVVATKKRLNLLEEQNKEQLNLQIQNTIAAVATAYYDIVRQQSYLKTLEKSIEAATSKLDIVNQQLKLGVSNNALLFQAEVDVNSLKQSLITQQTAVKQAYQDFKALVNPTLEQEISINDSISVDPNLKLDSLESYFKNNPEMLAAVLNTKISEQLVKETASQRYPTLRLNGGYNYNRNVASGGFFLLNQAQGPFVNLTLNLPIYNGNSFKRQQQSAKVAAQSSEIRKKSVELTYKTNAAKLWEAYQSSKQQLDLAQENYKIALQLLELVTKKFELRQATIVDVKMAQQSFENAAYGIVNLQFSAKAAEIELKRMAAKLDF